MKMMDDTSAGEVLRAQSKLFSLSVRRQMRLRKVRMLLGGTVGQRCLEITAGDGMISRQLRAEGGEWTTYVPSTRAKDVLSHFIQDEPHVLSTGAIDAPEHTFDAVVIVDALEWVADDFAFIKECHRVLKADGRLILTARRRLPPVLGGGVMRSVFGESWRRKGLARRGYTGRQFFDVLKDGFDVTEISSFSTCLVEAPGLFCELLANKLVRGIYTLPPLNAGPGHCDGSKVLATGGAMLYPLLWLFASAESWLLYLLPGHNLIAQTKRRVWRKRRMPILRDGRSIAEATINTKIGTAAPF